MLDFRRGCQVKLQLINFCSQLSLAQFLDEYVFVRGIELYLQVDVCRVVGLGRWRIGRKPIQLLLEALDAALQRNDLWVFGTIAATQNVPLLSFALDLVRQGVTDPPAPPCARDVLEFPKTPRYVRMIRLVEAQQPNALFGQVIYTVFTLGSCRYRVGPCDFRPDDGSPFFEVPEVCVNAHSLALFPLQAGFVRVPVLRQLVGILAYEIRKTIFSQEQFLLEAPAPTPAGLQALLERIAHRVGRHLERRGLLVRDAESAYLQWDGGEVLTN